MIERQQELRRRYHRKKKMFKLKAKLVVATGEDREKILYKIKRLSPWWTEASLTQKATSAKSTEVKKERVAKSNKAPAGRGPKAEKN